MTLTTPFTSLPRPDHRPARVRRAGPLRAVSRDAGDRLLPAGAGGLGGGLRRDPASGTTCWCSTTTIKSLDDAGRPHVGGAICGGRRWSGWVRRRRASCCLHHGLGAFQGWDAWSVRCADMADRRFEYFKGRAGARPRGRSDASTDHARDVADWEIVDEVYALPAVSRRRTRAADHRPSRVARRPWRGRGERRDRAGLLLSVRPRPPRVRGSPASGRSWSGASGGRQTLPQCSVCTLTRYHVLTCQRSNFPTFQRSNLSTSQRNKEVSMRIGVFSVLFPAAAVRGGPGQDRGGRRHRGRDQAPAATAARIIVPVDELLESAEKRKAYLSAIHFRESDPQRAEQHLGAAAARQEAGGQGVGRGVPEDACGWRNCSKCRW